MIKQEIRQPHRHLGKVDDVSIMAQGAKKEPQGLRPASAFVACAGPRGGV
ncbi:hypothetical protein ACFSQT_37585 [Mesorhizobium calcicola]|uniref:Uncharacterized protein n=1 Tax=Mesorhizobium calcicola TaxID=1300310 RepID=A0ABW4WSH6_9HYPH